MDQFVSFQSSYVEAPPHSVIVLGDRGFKVAIKGFSSLNNKTLCWNQLLIYITAIPKHYFLNFLNSNF